MRDLEYLDPIREKTYDTYRDLNAIFCDPYCKKKGYTAQNTLLIDSDSKKVQLWLDNTLISEPYSKEDISLLPS